MPHTRRLITVSALAALAALSIGLTSCGKSTSEKTAEKIIESNMGGDADVDISNDGESITINDGSGSISTGSNVKLPTSFPSTIPTPSGELHTASSNAGEFYLGYTVGDYKKAAADYAQALLSAGFTADVDYQTGSMMSTSFIDTSHTVTVVAVAVGVDGKSYLTLIVTPR